MLSRGVVDEHLLGTPTGRRDIKRSATAKGEFLILYKQQMPYAVFYPGKIYLSYKESETYRVNPILAPEALKWSVWPEATHLTSQPRHLGPGVMMASPLEASFGAASEMARKTVANGNAVSWQQER